MEAAIEQAISIHKCLSKLTTVPERTILAAVIQHDTSGYTFNPVAVASGLKCLSAARVEQLRRANPEVAAAAIRDMHAEVLAVRAFRQYLKDNLAMLFELKPGSLCLALKGQLAFYLYISAVPCGDASTIPDEIAAADGICKSIVLVQGECVRGRSSYGTPGRCRTKPGRADAPDTHCMSCSDKLARWSCIGVQGALLSEQVGPVYLAGVVVPAEFRLPFGAAMQRALNDRASQGILPNGYGRHPLSISYTNISFAAPPEFAPSNISMVWWSGCSKPEYIVGGFRQGTAIKDPRRITRRHYSLLGCPKSEQHKVAAYSYQQAKKEFHACPSFDSWINKDKGVDFKDG